MKLLVAYKKPVLQHSGLLLPIVSSYKHLENNVTPQYIIIYGYQKPKDADVTYV
jgi:hypothetical protein